MTALPTGRKTGSRYRVAGRAATASGVVGVLTLAILIAGVSAMLTAAPAAKATADLLFKTHHLGIVLQSLLMLPVAVSLQDLMREQDPGPNRVNVVLGVSALLLTILLAFLFVVGIVADDLYTVPQGFLGLWIIIESRRHFAGQSLGFARFGTVVGIGLLLVGTFPLAYAIFVDPIGLRGPIPPDYPNPDTTANTIIHDVFFVGSLLGVYTYPLWAILLGRRLRRAGSNGVSTAPALPTPSGASGA